jgi:beta-lactamase class A
LTGTGRWFVAVTLDESEAPAGGIERRSDRRRARATVRRRSVLHGISLTLAFVVAGLVLLLVGEPAAKQIVETVARPTVLGPLTPPEAAPGFDAEALQDRIEEIARSRGGVYGVAVLDRASGTRLSLRGEEEFGAASIGKLPPFAALYRAAARGELDLGEGITILPTDVQGYGSGVLHAFPEGYSLSLRDCAYYLVNRSDNTAWKMLNRRLGEEKIKAELEGMGIENSRYTDHAGYYTTPDDVLRLIERISDPRFTSEQLSAEMLDALTETTFEDRIPERLPLDVRIAHKTGSYIDSFGDAGVVFYKDRSGTEKHYHLVVLSRGAREGEARDVIQEISLAVYETLTGNQVNPGWSRGGSARRESGDKSPAIQPNPANTGPAKSMHGETSLSESGYEAIPNSPPGPAPTPSSAIREPVSSGAGYEAYPEAAIGQEYVW